MSDIHILILASEADGETLNVGDGVELKDILRALARARLVTVSGVERETAGAFQNARRKMEALSDWHYRLTQEEADSMSSEVQRLCDERDAALARIAALEDDMEADLTEARRLAVHYARDCGGDTIERYREELAK